MSVTGIYDSTSFAIAVSNGNEELQIQQSKSNQDDLHRPPQSDTVTISDEAKAVLEAKMQEYDAETPDDLTKEEKEDIKQTLENTEGVTEDDLEKLAKAEQGPPPGAGGGVGKGGGAGKPAGGGKPDSGGEKTNDTIEDLEDEITALEEEIEELRTKASKDEESKEEMKAKEVELMLLQAELTQEQNAANL